MWAKDAAKSVDTAPLPVDDTNQTLPNDADIIVNVLSYSSDTSQSFAMINGKLFRQGEFVRPGLRVEEIRVDAVVLNLRGRQIVRKP